MSKLFLQGSHTCPYCGSNISILEGLVYDYRLDSGGFPSCLHTESYRVAGFCEACNVPLQVIPNEEGGYTAYPEVEGVDLLMASVLKDKRSSVFANKLLDADNNPFINILDDEDCPF
jgi:hypothetical protein